MTKMFKGDETLKTIYKYSLERYKYNLEADNSNIIEVPLDTQILSVSVQGDDKIVIYGLVDTDQREKVSYDFKVYGTGYNIDNLEGYTFLGTVKTIMWGSWYFHVFYKQI